jgi:hypothetical protein
LIPIAGPRSFDGPQHVKLILKKYITSTGRLLHESASACMTCVGQFNSKPFTRKIGCIVNEIRNYPAIFDIHGGELYRKTVKFGKETVKFPSTLHAYAHGMK